MEDYPESYVKAARPLIVLSGICDEQVDVEDQSFNTLRNGPTISLPSAVLQRPDIFQAFMSFNMLSSNLRLATAPESSDIKEAQLQKFRMKVAKRKYVFACRKSSPLASQMDLQNHTPLTSTAPVSLHSPLSPLSPSSSLYPDGIMTPSWFLKYLDALPCVFITFYHIFHDPGRDSLNDNRLKAEINALKGSLAEHANYKGRLAVVIVADENVINDDTITDRLANIRKATKLENKLQFFYLAPNMSSGEILKFVESTLECLRPACFEFYKTLYKHARRKKERKSSMPNSPGPHNSNRYLLQSGWNVRYAIKLGFFSEVRLEMDTASRHYQDALDILLEKDGLFTKIDSWSPRFSEARTLADCISIRRARCLLVDGHAGSVTMFWEIYREKIKSILEAHGKGTSSYAWQTWEARWVEIMGQLVSESLQSDANINAHRILDCLSSKRNLAYVPLTELSRRDNNYNPWQQHLHHAGYWYALAAQYEEARAVLSSKIPDIDKIPPDQSPSTSLTRVHRTYDDFMCKLPHEEAMLNEHCLEVAAKLEVSLKLFLERRQNLIVEFVQNNLTVALVKSSRKETFEAIEDFWNGSEVSQRRQWHGLSRVLASSMNLLALQNNATRLLITTGLELLHSGKPQPGISWMRSTDQSRDETRYLLSV